MMVSDQSDRDPLSEIPIICPHISFVYRGMHVILSNLFAPVAFEIYEFINIARKMQWGGGGNNIQTTKDEKVENNTAQKQLS